MITRKRTGIVAGYTLVLSIVFLLLALAVVGIGGHGVLIGLRYDRMKEDVNEIDKALLYYSLAHHGMDGRSSNIEKYDDGRTVKLMYNEGPRYPATTGELGLLLTQFGYLPHEIQAVQGTAWDIYATEHSTRKANWYERGTDNSFRGARLTYETRYRYTGTSAAPNGTAGSVQEYSLTLTMPNGEVYKSPHSSY